MVVFRRIRLLMTPPIVSMPRERGVTSSNNMSVVPPLRISACTAAPSATTSSGFRWQCGGFPNSASTRCRTNGMRVEPPTKTTSSMSFAVSPASFNAIRQGAKVRSITVTARDSSWSRVSSLVKRPLSSGSSIVISVFHSSDKRILARSPSNRTACMWSG